MKLNRKTTLLALAMSAGLSVSALNPINLGSGLELTPLGTMLLDGATYAGENHKYFHTGAAIPEARLGALMTMGRWSARLEVGYAYNKVLLKDAYFQFDIDSHNYLRAGQTVHQFGLQNSTAACQKVTMIETENNTIFNESQMIGLMYVHADSTIFATASLHTESGATTSLTGGPGGLSGQSLGLRTRSVWHPFTDFSRGVAQIGLSAGFSTPEHPKNEDEDSYFSFSCNYPTRVNNVRAIGATIEDPRNLWKLSPELLLGYRRIALESQYYYMRVNRLHDLRHYSASGAYALLRGVLLGPDYEYSYGAGGIGTPRPGTLEGVLCWNWSNLSDSGVSLRGGRLVDYSLTLNYHINKFMTFRLRGGFVHVWDREGFADGNLASVQGRLQLIF
ncbi:MAG: ATPase [Bacteroides sp.]|nr:ATPase [Bacteroides sp.]